MENDGERSVPCSRRERCPLCAHAPPRARVAIGRAASLPSRTSPGRNGAGPNAWSSTNQPRKPDRPKSARTMSASRRVAMGLAARVSAWIWRHRAETASEVGSGPRSAMRRQANIG